jgi:squalene-hopene/tetraprenyl-beta-curcumene cyclase
LRLLEAIQPSNGGFLEAIPLTCFVVANLCGMGQHQHPVVARSVSFIYDLLREDGGWPIDTNLATWITTLSVQTLAIGCDDRRRLPDLIDTARIRDWLLAQQYRERHPFTDTPPGGISWTALPGAVPDADDTPGALLALSLLDGTHPAVHAAASRAITWLLDLQNRDGGMPTFCKGWGALPFDQSAADITSHSLAAMQHWRPHLPTPLQHRVDRAMPRLIRYLQRSQRADGSWVPLWFGNEHAPGDQNPTYGTSRCLAALARCALADSPGIVRALRWLLAAQQEHGGWSGVASGPASLEETGLATDALLCWLPRLKELGPEAPLAAEIRAAAERGVAWIIAETQQGTRFPPHPIGFYFAKLWYYESTYPLIFALAALERWQATFPPTPDTRHPAPAC